MRVLDLFAGTGSATKAFEDAGHEVIKVELDEYFEAHERDILTLTADYLTSKYGQFDFVWASPPCTTFSIASVRHYWHYVDNQLKPKNEKTLQGINLVKHTLKLLNELNATYGWVMENPRGMLRKQEFMQNYKRNTITYCQYGDTRMKPTDVWNNLTKWTPKAMCKPRAACHESSPRGTSAGGTAKLRGSKLRSMIPYNLGLELLKTIEGK